MASTEKLTGLPLKLREPSDAVPVALFVPAMIVQLEPAVPVASVVADPGDMPGANATLTPSMGVCPLGWRVLTVTLTGAEIDELPTGMYCGEPGPLPVALSLVSTAAK